MQIRKPQSEHDKISDQVYAAMETGNPGRARTILTEYAAVDKDGAQAIRVHVLDDYGVSL